VFGEIVEGLDEILSAFNEAICDEEHRPYQVQQDMMFFVCASISTLII
jgi:hypothetical protein